MPNDNFKPEVYHSGQMVSRRRVAFMVALGSTSIILQPSMSYDMHYRYLSWRAYMCIVDTAHQLKEDRDEYSAKVLHMESM